MSDVRAGLSGIDGDPERPPGSLADATPADPAAAPAGRSPWADAWIRLRRNRAAVVSMGILVVMILLAVFGPLVTGHRYDEQYRGYVKVPPQVEPHPAFDAVAEVAQSALRRARVEVDAVVVEGETVRLTVTNSRDGPLDDRIVRYVDRPDDFSNARVVETVNDGRTAVIEADVERIRFWMGTDSVGRDLMTRIFLGLRISLAIGFLAAVVALAIGIVYGAVAGYVGGRVDDAMMRFVDILYSLPFIFFVILLVVFFGRNLFLMFVAVGAVEWLDMARIVRGQTLSIKRQEYVEAAKALGVRGPAIVRRHVVPNLLGPVIVYMTLLVPKVILLESFLSFLGLGVQEPLTSLGVLISEGARNIQGAPYLLIFPSIFLTLTLFALNFIGDGLRDALDPKDR